MAINLFLINQDFNKLLNSSNVIPIFNFEAKQVHIILQKIFRFRIVVAVHILIQSLVNNSVEYYIPNIFKEIIENKNITRDCSENCYGKGNERISIPEKKICCPNFKFSDNCYDKCPQRTKVFNESKKCESFNCSSNYNYEQTDCLEQVPEGFYINDTELKTIDKCHENCKTCIKGPTETNTNCLSCNEKLRYHYFGNCFNSCDYGFYQDSSGILKCKCGTQECSDYSEESLKQNLCIKCSEGYYTKDNDIISNSSEFKKCYRNPPKYYFNYKTQNYHPCYSSCDRCYGQGNEQFHNCSICDSDHNLEIIKNKSDYISKNCYVNCPYYFYFNNDIYSCTKTYECPPCFNFIVAGSKQCVKSCKETEGYFKQFRKYCFKECPLDIAQEREDIPNLCKPICPYELPFELVELQICVESCSIMERSKKLCITNNYENRTNLQMQEIIYEDIINDLISSFNFSIIGDYKSVIIEENNTIYEIVSSNNKNQSSNTSKIDFGQCISVLKNYYRIAQNESLIILKMDTYIEGKTGPTSLYEIFYPLENSENLVKLDLTPCEGEKISVLHSMELIEPELYDRNNPIYKDICYPYSIKEGVDTSLGELQNNYFNNNKSLCEENCEFSGYDEENKFYKCDCEMKETMPKISEIKSDKSKLNNFDKIKNFANFNVLRCINLITTKKGLIRNIGFYSFIPTLIAYVFCVIMFCKKKEKIINTRINNFLYNKKCLYFNQVAKEKEEKEKNLTPARIQKISKKNSFDSRIKDNNIKKSNLIKDEINNINKNKQFKHNSSLNRFKNRLKDKMEVNKVEKNFNNKFGRFNLNRMEDKIEENDIIIINREKVKNSITKRNKNNFNNIYDEYSIVYFKNKSSENLVELKEKENSKMNQIKKISDLELNSLQFKQALKYDYRTYCQYYFSLLRTDHILIKLLNSRDYNSNLIKIYLILYNFCLSFAVNALFFDDETIEQIFKDGGKFNLLYQIPQIIYSSIISFIFYNSLDILGLSEDNIIIPKNKKILKYLMNHAKKLWIILQIKFIYFFIISFIFLLFFWYYITCFCAVYKNTQYHLIKNTIIGFAISLLNPLIFKLIPGIFRIYGIRHKNLFIYKLSQKLEIIC